MVANRNMAVVSLSCCGCKLLTAVMTTSTAAAVEASTAAIAAARGDGHSGDCSCEVGERRGEERRERLEVATWILV